MKRVLVTGGSGFVGIHVVRRLADHEYDVHVVGRSKVRPYLLPQTISWHQADLLSSSARARLLDTIQASHLVHLAWYTEPHLYWGSSENVRWLEASLALMRTFAHCGGQRALLIGSCAEYDLRKGGVYSEEMPLVPSTLYGACKSALQSVTAAASAELGVTTAWARLFHLYGPGEHVSRLVSSVVTALMRTETVQIRHGALLRDYLYIEDAASALVSLLNSEWLGPINLGTGSPVSVSTIASEVAGMMNSPQLLRSGGNATAATEPAMIIADIARLRDEIGWHPQFTRDAGLERTIQWWRDQSR